MAYRAGALRDRAAVLTLETFSGGVRWATRGLVWLEATWSKGRRAFSTYGNAGVGVDVVMRVQDLNEGNAILWQGEHLFITSVREQRPGWLDVACALVEVTECVAEAGRTPQGMTFPGVLCGKYIKYRQEEPMAANDHGLVLVTPKAAALSPGSLVDAGGVRYVVETAHTLERWRNEYELGKRRDL